MSNECVDTYHKKINRNEKSIFLTPCTEYEIRKIIQSLKNKKSSRHDGISNILLKDWMDVIICPLYLIFNKSLNTGIFPDQMKHADVVPLHKNGSIQLVDNYRPISLLPTISKVLEKLMYSRVYNFLDTTNQIYDSQYGFRSKQSCEHAISELVGNILKGKEKSEYTLSVFLDLSKAFDTLEYSTLFKKLEIYGICRVALKLFESYLSECKMRTKCFINNKLLYSGDKNVTYGATQGSCLGPLLFLIFYNDLHLNLKYVKCILFADDTIIFYSNRNLSLLIAALEYDLTTLSDWFKANKLTLNKKKSVCLLFGTTDKIQSHGELNIDGTIFPCVDNMKFLGVWIDKSLNWNMHIEKLILKLHRNSQLLFKSKKLLSNHAKKILYYAQIYSHINYGISIWGPLVKKGLLKKIEKIQMNCLKCINPTKVNDFLSATNLIKLEMLKFGWRLVHKELPISLQNCALSNAHGSTLIKHHRYSTRNKRIPNIPIMKSTQYKSSIFCKGIGDFGILPHEIRKITNYKTFCKKTREWLILTFQA